MDQKRQKREPFDNSNSPQSDCACCGFCNEGVEKEFPILYYRRRDMEPDSKYKWLCNLCAESSAGMMIDFPGDYPNHKLAAVACFVGNMILKELRGKKE